MAKDNSPKAPDNNKRLAALESGVALLVIALTGRGIAADVAEVDPFGSAITLIEAQSEAVKLPASMLATALAAAGVNLTADADPVLVAVETLGTASVTSAEIQRLADYLLAKHPDAIEGSAVDTALKLLEAAAAGPTNATDGEIAAIARAEAAEKELAQVKIELGETQEDLERLASEKGKLANELAELIENKGYKRPEAESAAEPEPEPIFRERPESAREFHPSGGKLDKREIAELVAAGAEFEIGFSNGEYEIVGLAPVAIEAKDLGHREGRLMLNRTVIIRGDKEHEEAIDGAVLIYGGEQIDYCRFPTPRKVAPNSQRQFVREIFFG